MVRPPYSKVYWACAAVLANRRAAIANSFLIIISWAGGTPTIPIPMLCFGNALQRDLCHFHNISREQAGLVQYGTAGNLVTAPWVVNFRRKAGHCAAMVRCRTRG
jgi:hypothetical protein